MDNLKPYQYGICIGIILLGLYLLYGLAPQFTDTTGMAVTLTDKEELKEAQQTKLQEPQEALQELDYQPFEDTDPLNSTIFNSQQSDEEQARQALEAEEQDNNELVALNNS